MWLDLDGASVNGRWRWFGLRGRVAVVAFFLADKSKLRTFDRDSSALAFTSLR